MKLEKEGPRMDVISVPSNALTDKREVCLFQILGQVGFYRNEEGPKFTFDELRELLPYLQRAIEHNSFELPPKYELVELGRDTFAIRKTANDTYYNRSRKSSWGCSDASLYTEEEAKDILAQLEEGRE